MIDHFPTKAHLLDTVL